MSKHARGRVYFISLTRSTRAKKYPTIHLSLTSISCHVAIDLQRASFVLRVDPVFPVSSGVSSVPDVLAGISRPIWLPTYSLKTRLNQVSMEDTPRGEKVLLSNDSKLLCYPDFFALHSRLSKSKIHALYPCSSFSDLTEPARMFPSALSHQQAQCM